MNNQRRIPTLTPCVGRCSTVFGDAVCRGCRRYNHEVIQWNTYHLEQRVAVWTRLDAQLDQVLLPLLPMAQLHQVEQFILSKRVRVLDTASKGRKIYQALKLCEKNKNFAAESGLGIAPQQVKPIWDEFERRALALGKASYDFAWLRADMIGQTLLQWHEREDEF